MALSKMQRQKIIESLIIEIGKNSFENTFSVDDFSKSHGLSKQSVYRYLASLAAESKITIRKTGKNNQYRLTTTVHNFKFNLANLSEDIVWSKNIKPLLIDLPEVALANCNYVFCEMLNNAIEHSEGSEVEIELLINAYSVNFLISDNGVGIFAKIASAMNLEEKRFAILELAKGKFTTEPDSHTGEGIFFSSKACDYFAILSSDLQFITASNLNINLLQDDLLLDDFQIFQNRSTIISFTIFRDHAQKMQSIFDQYTQNPNGYGFNKTVVPIKLLEYGDPSPTFISRSQAKRLLVRFERFELIILDFNGIDEIGQGFADEIFRVFLKQHPQCKILTKNCNINVTNMIRHVANHIVTE